MKGYINRFTIFPLSPAGFNPASPVFPVTGSRPVNILTATYRPAYRQPEPVRETVKQ
jgi:hypothetical protein